MILLLLILIPLTAAFAAWFAGSRTWLIRSILLLTALSHTVLTICAICSQSPASFFWRGQEWIGIDIGLDDAGTIFLLITSLLFLFVSLHTLMWLPADRAVEGHTHKPAGFQRDSVFIPCMLAFLSTMTLVITARNFGLLWVAVEATTLVSAPLICFHRSDRSLEAMWKYLLICSVGIGLALFGTMLMAVAAESAGHIGMNMTELAKHSDSFHTGWFKAAFIFILAGYGTKMGLAPFHTWLPDAHSEAPGTISALLSGSLLNCSFLGIIRFCQITPEELKPFCSNLLIALGFLSLIVAAFFIIRQSDFKRMLAYSSVEHMGLAALLWGSGLESVSFLHLCGHSVLKMALFLLAGNILLAYGTRSVAAVGGMFGRIPRNAVLWITAILLICGTPPSPLFVTEYLLVRESGFLFGAVVLLLLFAVFAGMSMACLKMCMGNPQDSVTEPERTTAAERLWVIPAAAVIIALAAGTFLTFILNQGEL